MHRPEQASYSTRNDSAKTLHRREQSKGRSAEIDRGESGDCCVLTGFNTANRQASDDEASCEDEPMGNGNRKAESES
jgi:hypothetical protein